MKKRYDYYRNTAVAYTREADNLKKKIHLLGSIRLLLTVGLIGMFWFFKSEDWKVLVGIAIVFVLPFIALLVGHTRLFARKCYAEALAKLCQDELNGLEYDFSAFDGAPEKSSAEHSFSLDLDLFGKHSLFQSINRTVTFMGKEKLADWFTQPLTDKGEIVKRQEAVRELESFTQLRQHFYVTGILQPGNEHDKLFVSLLSKTTPRLIGNKIWEWLIYLFPSAWVLIATGCILNLLPVSMAGAFFGLSFLVAYFNTKQIATIHNSLDKLEQILQTYSDLIRCIEKENFRSTELATIHDQLAGNGHTASSCIKKLSRHIGALNQRFSAIGVVLNIFTLRYSHGDETGTVEKETWSRYGTVARSTGFVRCVLFVSRIRLQPSGLYLSRNSRHLFQDGRQSARPSVITPGHMRKEQHLYPEKSLVSDYYGSKHGGEKHLPAYHRYQLSARLCRRSGLCRILDFVSRADGNQPTYFRFPCKQ